MKKIVTVKNYDDCEVRALEGYGPGSPAVKVIWGYSTGSDTGLHNLIDSFALAELGILDDNGDFESIVWKESDYGKRIFAKSLIGCPKEYEGWTPDEDTIDDNSEIDWNDFDKWMDDYCNQVL